MTEEKFKYILNSAIKEKDNIKIEELTHDKSFIKEGIYNGYDISYIMVKYIFESKNKAEIIRIFRNQQYIIANQQEIFEKALDYFSITI